MISCFVIMTTESNHRIIPLQVDVGAAALGFGSARSVTPAHRRIMKHYTSPFLMGPPPSDTLLELIAHLYTEEEAELAQHLPPLRGRTAEQIARLAKRPVQEVERVMENLATVKCILIATEKKRRYAIMPIVPGTFELALMTPDLSTRNSWHRRFAELFERLWDDGYMKDYLVHSRASIRYFPVNGVSKTLTSAWPSDHFDEVLAPHKDFAVGNCQCRLAMKMVGKGCDRPLENCVAFGPGALRMIQRSNMRKADRQEILDIKRKAEEAGCVNFMVNAMGSPKQSNGSCSCCGCCCHVLRMITEFNIPSAVCRPHYMPQRTAEVCTLCGQCACVCPTHAWSLHNRELSYDAKRCIGCGLCVVSCKFKALSLHPVAEANPPENSWLMFIAKMIPGYLNTSVRVWAKRIFHAPSL
jgi:electron transport complex protein RnfB